MDIPKSEAQTVADIVRTNIAPLTIAERKGVVVFPQLGQIKNIDDERFDANPRRRRASVNLIEAQSFIDYVNRFKILSQTVVFGVADETGGTFKAIIDYHDSNSVAGTDSSSGAHWGEHNCTLTLQTTPEWKRWIGNNNKPLNQEQFCEFIEDNANDIMDPDAATLLDIAQFLQGTKAVTFKSGKNLRTGATQLEYTESILDANGNSTGRRDDKGMLPQFMKVKLAPFVGSAAVEVMARLRFRISDSGKLSLSYILDRPFKVIEAAFTIINADIEKETAVPVMLGNGGVVAPTIIQ